MEEEKERPVTHSIVGAKRIALLALVAIFGALAGVHSWAYPHDPITRVLDDPGTGAMWAIFSSLTCLAVVYIGGLFGRKK